MEGIGTFATLHNAYLDEWLSIAFLPHVKQTFNTENNFYDIEALNMKKVNVSLLPVAEAVMAMDRQYQTMRFALERALSETPNYDIDRLLLIETHQSSFSTFIEGERSLLEKAIIDIGGRPPTISTNTTTLSISSTSPSSPTSLAITNQLNEEQQQQQQPHQQQTMIGAGRRVNNNNNNNNNNNTNNNNNQVTARSRLKSDGTFALLGPITLLWVEFMTLLSKIVDEKERLFYLESTINNLAFSVIEWRIMLANSQKIINEDKKVKKVNIYDQMSATFMSSPINVPNNHHLNQDNTSLFGGIDGVDISNISLNTSQSININNNNQNNQNNNQNIPNSFSSSYRLTQSYHSPPKYPLPPTPSNSISVSQSSSSPELLVDVTIDSHNNSPTSNHLVTPSSSLVTPASPSHNLTPPLQPERASVGGWHKAVVSAKLNNSSVNNSSSNSSISLNSSNNQAEGLSFQSNPLEAMSKGVPSGGIIKQGWMRKRGNKVKSWKKRYFILDMRKTMIYYDLPSSQHQQHHSDQQTITNPQLITASPFDSTHHHQPHLHHPTDSDNNNSSSTSNSSSNNTNSSSISSSNEQNIVSYEHLKYKGSIDLHTAIFVAIKPNNCNINVNFENSNSSGKDKDKDSDNQYFGIDIRTPKRIWHLCCDSSKSMEDWLVALKSALKY